MFEQDRYSENQRSRGMFRDSGQVRPGMSRYQVSGVEDSDEIAAEEAADQAVGGLFRTPEGDGGGFQADLADADLSGGGSPLPEGLMGPMEQSLGASFSGVRLHTDAGADRASRQISARAFTRGQDIYFRGGAYSPDTQEGQHLIAHELAHVAAGDGGIHRAGDDHTKSTSTLRASAGSSGIDRGTILEMALENSTKVSREDLTQANAFIGECGTRESLAAEIRAGKIGKEGVQNRLDRSRQVKASLDAGIGDLEKVMGEYRSQMSGAAEQNEYYKEAQAAHAGLKEAREQLQSTVEPALQWAMEGLNARDSGSGEEEFPKTVARMLDDPACGQFFKAVADVQKGAAGAENFEALNQQAVTGAANLHGDVAESKWEKVGRVSGNVGMVNGIASFGTDMLSGASDINSEKENMTAKDENLRHASGAFSTTTAAVGAAADTAGLTAEAKILRDQEAERKRKIQAMEARNAGAGVDTGIGSARSADHTARVATAGSGFGAAGGFTNIGSSIAGSFKSDNDTAGEWNNALGTAGSVAGTIGDTLGLAADSQNAEEMRQKDKAAKDSMRALGKQLEGTLPARRTGRSTLIASVCDRVKGRSFNSVKGEDNQMGALIQTAISGERAGVTDPQAKAELKKPELTSKQAGLLGSMKALETSRAAAKGAAAAARKDALFSTLSLTGSLTGLIGNALKMAGLGLAGTIVGMVGSLFGLVGSVKDAVDAGQENDASRQQERNEERDAKVSACQTAVSQMAALPPLSLDALKASRQARLPLPAAQLEAAEQYAAVFSIVESANVNMVDFLYAVDSGAFGTESGGQRKGLNASLADMYAALSFT